MTRYPEWTRQLAELVVGFGANVQPGQLVGVTSYVGKEELTREVARAAYARGARYVDVLYFDQWLKRERLLGAPADSLGEIPPWMRARLLHLSEQRGARIALRGPQAPSALEGIPPDRTGLDLLPYLPETGAIVNAATTNWCVAPGPSAAWAEAVYPELSPDAALDRLWEAIAHICRLDEPDPVQAWRQRVEALQESAGRLTARRFDAIRLHGPGTDLTVGLFPSSAWQAAGFTTVDGVEHVANIPSEETFTTPDPARADGHVSATMPLELYGTVVEGIRVEFASGRAVRIDAAANAEALRAACAKDEGASRLGEIALVDGAGRIGPLQTVFLDTLLDENAASHVALGSAYEACLEDAADRERANTSQVHIDFMIGSPELDVDGITGGGEHVPVLRRGAWQL